MESLPRLGVLELLVLIVGGMCCLVATIGAGVGLYLALRKRKEP